MPIQPKPCGLAGSMMFMDAGIGMDTVFGDGSAQTGGFFGKLMGAGKRLVTAFAERLTRDKPQ